MARSKEQIRHHYEVEKRLAKAVMLAPPEKRREISLKVHEQLFIEVPDHPLRTRRLDLRRRNKSIARELRYLKPWLKPDTAFLEIGASDCALSLAVAPMVKAVIAVDIVDHTLSLDAPPNFRHVISDGVSIPAQDITVAYSNQLMEHLHPDDAVEQLDNIVDALVPGGVYLCNTPNRLHGPHDISRHFDDVATGFHLKEYTIRELARLFRKKFQHVTYIPKSGLEVPVYLGEAYETICSIFPRKVRLKIPLPLMLAGYK